MPTFIKGNLWDELEILQENDLLLVTTNSYVTIMGLLAMGRGAAREAALRFPELPKIAGACLIEEERVKKIYGVRSFLLDDVKPCIGIFQVKLHWQDDARLDVIGFSCGALQEIAYHYGRIAMNFPGVGWGRLKRESVLPLLEPLPEHVVIYEYKN